MASEGSGGRVSATPVNPHVAAAGGKVLVAFAEEQSSLEAGAVLRAFSADTIFEDGFEDGTTGGWSSTVP